MKHILKIYLIQLKFFRFNNHINLDVVTLGGSEVRSKFTISGTHNLRIPSYFSPTLRINICVHTLNIFMCRRPRIIDCYV